MEDKKMIGLVNGYLHDCSTLLIKWLGAMLPRVSNNWWQDCVIDRLSFNQRAIVDENKITKLNEFDLAALLRIADKNWYAMRDFSYLPTNERDCIRDMIVVRNRWAHLSGELPDKRKIKLEQMADNEVRKAQELSRLEDEEKELFGFDLSNKTMTKEIQDAESPWLSQKSLQSLAVMYLNDRIGSGNYILGETEAKTIRLSVAARNLLREDLKKLSGVPNAIRKKWDAYLKGTVPTHSITFDQECAAKDKNAFFITAVHPLIKQAAVHFSVYAPAYVNIRYATDAITNGEYAFSIYAWNYVGTRSRFKLVAVSENDVISNDFIEILLGGVAGLPEKKNFDERWKSLESNHVALWTKERQDFLEEANLSVTYKLGSLESNFLNRKRALEQQIREACDENLRRMKQGELENATERYEAKAAEIKRQAEQADIHTALVAHGIIHIE